MYKENNSAMSPFWTYSPDSREYLSAFFFMLKQQTRALSHMRACF